jgi:hypothetical protein
MARSRATSWDSSHKILLNAALIALAFVITTALPNGNGPVAVFAGPWSDNAAEIAARAGGKLVAAGRSDRIVVAISDGDDFVGRLYRSGAILVTDPRYAIGCRANSGGTP